MTESRFEKDVSWDEDPIEDWSQDQLLKRTEELKLIGDNDQYISSNEMDNGRHRFDDNSSNEIDDGTSKSASTTSDSQVN